MKELKTYCDHCGKQIPNLESGAVRPYIFIEYYLEADLCDDCKKTLQKVVGCFVGKGECE